MRCIFAEWQRATEVFPFYLTQQEAATIHDLGIQCLHLFHVAAHIALQQSQLRWQILPKMHIFHHMCLDVLEDFYNPRAVHCFSGESFMGFVKAVCQATNMAPNMEERVLRRTLLKVVTGSSEEVAGCADENEPQMGCKWMLWGQNLLERCRKIAVSAC